MFIVQEFHLKWLVKNCFWIFLQLLPFVTWKDDIAEWSCDDHCTFCNCCESLQAILYVNALLLQTKTHMKCENVSKVHICKLYIAIGRLWRSLIRQTQQIEHSHLKWNQVYPLFCIDILLCECEPHLNSQQHAQKTVWQLRFIVPIWILNTEYLPIDANFNWKDTND